MTLSEFKYKVEEHIIPWFSGILPDRIYLKWLFRHRMGYPLNLDDPKTYNEKLQWLKLYDRHPEYTQFVDKVQVKPLVASIAGEAYVIPTLGVWNSVDEIDWDALPDRFVVKSTNDSGGVVVCRDKAALDIQAAKALLKQRGARNYAELYKEYPYRDVPHRFIAEAYLEEVDGRGLMDYKFFCFDGEPKFLFVASGRREKQTRFDFFDIDFNHLPLTNGYPNADRTPEKPENFEEMVNLASVLSKGFPHVRVDLYNVGGKVYFGEITFFHWSGIVPFDPMEWDYKFGEYLHLPSSKT